MSDRAELRESLDSYLTVGRSFTISGDLSAGDGQGKTGQMYPPADPERVAEAQGAAKGTFTIDCDEPDRLGGTGTAQQPLQYFLAGIAF